MNKRKSKTERKEKTEARRTPRRAALHSTPTRPAAQHGRLGRHLVALSSAALIVLVGCGAPAPEERLAAASVALEDTAGDLTTVNVYIQETQTKLSELEERRRQLRNEVRTLEERVAARATDVALFRAIQTALLDEPTLREAALTAQVEDAEVTLSGSVTSPEQEARALAIARDVAGVAAVNSRIRVDSPASAGRVDS